MSRLKDKFETTDTGRGSRTHMKRLKREIKAGLTKMQVLKALDKMSLEEINDRAEVLLKQIEEKGRTDDISLELEVIQDILMGVIQRKKEGGKRCQKL